MVKQRVGSTQGANKFRYTSFRDKIDDLRIEPAKNLTKRHHDFVETSHFLSSFEHWRDINRSGDFTNFVEEIENDIQTLAQILYHQKKIFECLKTHIDNHDEKSLQPLCELLAQFVHDLGPDFMVFYEDSLKCLLSMLESAVNMENSGVFEWGFNCLAYMFKYLSRTLSQDLSTTFELLFPLLSHQKEYLSRFSAEALSFLVRKSKATSLTLFIESSIDKLNETKDDNFYDGLEILFEESLKTTSENLHSKSSVIISALLKKVISDSCKETVSLFCDILMDILRHGSTEAVADVYDLILEKIDQALVAKEYHDIDRLAKILATMAFAESGKKISSWEKFVKVVNNLMQNTTDTTRASPETVAFLFAALLRNCDVSMLTQFHKKMFEFYQTTYSETFLEFFRNCLNMATEKLITFSGAKYLQKYIKDNWNVHFSKISLFLFDIEENENLRSKLNIIIPDEFIKYVLSNLKAENDDYSDILRNLHVLNYVSDSSKIADIIPLLVNVSNDISTFDDFQKDVFGTFLQLSLFTEESQIQQIYRVLESSFQNISELRSSLYFIKGMKNLISHLKKQESSVSKLKQYFQQNDYEVIKALTDNLLLPNSNLRYETLHLLYDMMTIAEYEIPDVLRSCVILEEMPQTLQYARDFTVRIRAMGSDYSKIAPNTIHNMIFFKHLFGLLNVRFSPIWDGVYEIMPTIYEKGQQLVWDLSLKFLKVLDNNFVLNYPSEHMSDLTRERWWNVSVARLDDAIGASNRVFDNYFFQENTVLDFLKERRGQLEYPQLIRNQTLKLLLLIPALPERHSKELVPFFFNDKETEEVFGEDQEAKDSSAAMWTDADRNLLLKLLGKFKNIRSAYNSEKIYERLMILLSSRSVEVQKAALIAVFAYKDKILNKYRENLTSLLDDTLFKDEISKLLATDETRIIEDNDGDTLMPIVLRILFGRAQTPTTSGIKKARKNAVIGILPSFDEKYITQFLHLGSERVNYSYYFQDYAIDNNEVTMLTLRRMTGFVNIINSLFSILGSKFPRAMESIIHPLIYSSAMASHVLASKLTENNIDKMAVNVRQQTMRAFYQLFEYYGENLNWDNYRDALFKVVINPRIALFEDENLQQPSAIMKMITFWSTDRSLYKFLYFNNFCTVHALMRTLSNPKVKESVVATILKFVNSIVSNASEDEEYPELVALSVSVSLNKLPVLFSEIMSQDVSNIAVDVLLNITNAGFIQDNETRKLLVESLSVALGKHVKSIALKDVAKILSVLVTVVSDFDCSWNDIEPLYKQLASLFRIYADKTIRITLADVFVSIGQRFSEYSDVGQLLSDLNSYSTNRMQGYDFERRLPAFKRFIENDFKVYSELCWLPVLYSCLFFINDTEELAIRTNATSVINSFTDYINLKGTEENAKDAIELMKDVILTHLKLGLRKKTDDIKNEYISVLAYIVTNSEVYTELNDMKVLLMKGDQEADFFVNINHIQVHRRQRAVKRLCELAPQLHENSISHYLIPAIENWIFCEEEKYRNLSNEVVTAMGSLSNYVSWNQYKALFRRFKSMLKMDYQYLKEVVIVLVNISASLKNSLLSTRDPEANFPIIRQFPHKLSESENFIKNEAYPDLTKFLAKRDDETIVARIPLSEATINLTLGLSSEDIVSFLPGTLTSVCQVLRSRSEELRDAVRKNLGKITVILGAEYLTFIIKELRGALTRGSQIHVLSFTMHHVLVSLSEDLQQGDMDAASDLITGVLMEDIFGAAGQEKDAEGYHSKMKEVKHNKSYDTGEMLATNINLAKFGSLLRPIKALLLERLPLKIQNKLDELLRRYALGLSKNPESGKIEVLNLCYEIYEDSTDSNAFKKKNKPDVNEKEDFFLVKLNAKHNYVETENSLYGHTLQKFAFDMLRSSITKNATLLDVKYLEGFVPILKKSLSSEDEGVLVSTLRILTIFVKLDFSEENEPIFKNCARKVFNIIKDSPSTSSELCQLGLKFLSVLIKYKDVELKNSALSYVLTRILPDFNEPHKQGLAFNFLKSLISKHVVLPELYDVVDSISEIMVANHTKEIRDVARSVFYQFLMEYDHSKGRIEKKFKFLVDNLEYPSPEGRVSVMELISLIVNKSSPELLSKLSSSLFVALSNVAVNDDFPKCRQMATHLLSNLLETMGEEKTATVEKYITAWLKQTSNDQFLSLGLRVYKIYFGVFGLNKEHNEEIHELAMSRVKFIIENTDVGSDMSWELVYIALQLFGTYTNKASDEIYKSAYDKTWANIINCLLYPHPWIRLASSRVINILIENLDKFESEISAYQIQTIAFKIFRQLGAPSISENLADVSVQTLVPIIMKWKSANQQYIMPQDDDNEETKEDDDQGESDKYKSSIGFAISKAAHILRSEKLVFNESFVGKKAMVKLLALMIQILDAESIKEESEQIIMALYMYLERNYNIDEKEEELQDLAKECVQFLEAKLTVSEFTLAYSNVKQQVWKRRQERKAKRAVLAVTAPDVAANRKLKKHARSREKRKHEKDENGFYKKKRRT